MRIPGQRLSRGASSAITVLLLLASLRPPTAAAQTGQPAAPPQMMAPIKVEFAAQQYLGEGITKAELSNGLTVLVRENHAAPVATVRCFVRNTGSAYEGRFLGAGISHMLEHLVAGGTTSKKSEDDIQLLLDTMGGQTNAFTSTDMTAFYIDCPAKHAPLAIELIAEEMQFAEIPEDEYQREMEVVQRELEMGEADRDRVLHQAMKELLYIEHPIRHPTIGYLPVVQRVTRQDVINFYKSRYVPQNMIFIVVGDLDTAQTLEQVRAVFQNFHRTTERGAVLPTEPDQASPRSSRREMPGETVHYSVGWPTIPLQHPDLYALDVASYLLAHGDSSRIAYRLKVEQPLAIAVDSSSYTPGFVRGWFDVQVQCPPANLDACRRVVEEEIERLKQELIRPEELAKVKRQKSAEHVFAQQTVQDQANALAYSFISTGDPLFDEQYVAGIQQVTAEQVRSAAQKYLRPERTNTAIIDPLGAAPPTTEDKLDQIESAVVRRQLPNGLTLLLKRHALTPTVSIHAFVKGGVLAETRQNSGVAALTTELMPRGTEKYSGREIAEYFDSIGGALSVDSQRSTSFLQCAILKDDLAEVLDYVDQVLFHPTFAEDEFQKVRDQQLARIAARKANPQSEIMDFWAEQLPETSPYSRTVLGTRASVEQLKVADCRRYHDEFVVPNNMVLAIYGDIDPAAVEAQITKLMADEPRRGDLAFPALPKEPIPTDGETAHLTSPRENTAMLLLSYPTVAVDQQKTRAALDVVEAVLTGGGGLGGRLFFELRGEGLVYYVFGMEMTGPAPGYFLMLSQTRPEKVAEVKERIQQNVRRLAEEGLTAEELQRAQDKLIAAHAMRNTTPATQAFQAAIDELYGLGYDNDRTYDERIRSVTSEDVVQVVKRYFNHPIVVSSSPESAAAR